MTVAELIAALDKFPQDAVVLAEYATDFCRACIEVTLTPPIVEQVDVRFDAKREEAWTEDEWADRPTLAERPTVSVVLIKATPIKEF